MNTTKVFSNGNDNDGKAKPESRKNKKEAAESSSSQYSLLSRLDPSSRTIRKGPPSSLKRISVKKSIEKNIDNVTVVAANGEDIAAQSVMATAEATVRGVDVSKVTVAQTRRRPLYKHTYYIYICIYILTTHTYTIPIPVHNISSSRRAMYRMGVVSE